MNMNELDERLLERPYMINHMSGDRLKEYVSFLCVKYLGKPFKALINIGKDETLRRFALSLLEEFEQEKIGFNL